MAAAAVAALLVKSSEVGWEYGTQASITRRGDPAVNYIDPSTGAPTRFELDRLDGLSATERKAWVAYVSAFGEPPPEVLTAIPRHPYLDETGQWRWSDTNEPAHEISASRKKNKPVELVVLPPPGTHYDVNGDPVYDDDGEPFDGYILSPRQRDEAIPLPDKGQAAGRWPVTHVQQGESNWCGAAAGEMVARQLGVELTQDELAGTSFFREELESNGQLIHAGGFRAKDLVGALNDRASVADRFWHGGQIRQDISTSQGLVETLGGYLASTDASIIVRVHRGNHWIVVDGVLADGSIVIRDPAAEGPAVVSPDELLSSGPTGDMIFSFQEK